MNARLPVRLLLVGMMGAGKSTVGAEIARRTGWPHLDNDELLVAELGLDAMALLVSHGEQALRDAESGVLHGLLHRDPPFVAGVPAGVVTRDDDRAAMRGGGAHVVWLRARVETLVRNVRSGTDRPWLAPDPMLALHELSRTRGPWYAEVADVVIDVDDRSVSEVADQILFPAQR